MLEKLKGESENTSHLIHFIGCILGFGLGLPLLKHSRNFDEDIIVAKSQKRGPNSAPSKLFPFCRYGSMLQFVCFAALWSCCSLWLHAFGAMKGNPRHTRLPRLISLRQIILFLSNFRIHGSIISVPLSRLIK